MKSEIEAGDLMSGLIGNIQDVVRSLKGKVTQTIELPRGSKEESVAFLKSSYVGNNNEPKAISKVAEGIDLTH